jgi:hypothetical protein
MRPKSSELSICLQLLRFGVDCYGHRSINGALLMIDLDDPLCTSLLRFGITKLWSSVVVKLASPSRMLFRNAASDLLFSRKTGLATHGTSSVGIVFA